MSQKVSSGVALAIIFSISIVIGLLLWLGNEREMRADDPRLFDFEKPGGNKNWLNEEGNKGENMEKNVDIK
jgi:hypothetical protein